MAVKYFWNDCTAPGNDAAALGTTVYSEVSATTRFDRCEFLGERDVGTCIVYSDDSTSKFLFYYQQTPFKSGTICSASQVLVYNSDVSVSLSISHEGSVTCQPSNILEYCDFDCASSEGGIACSCISDG